MLCKFALVVAKARDPGVGPFACVRMTAKCIDHFVYRVDDRRNAGDGLHCGRNPAWMRVDVAKGGENRPSRKVDGRNARAGRGFAGTADPSDASVANQEGVGVPETFAVVNDGMVKEDVVHEMLFLKKRCSTRIGQCRREGRDIKGWFVRRQAASGEERR